MIARESVASGAHFAFSDSRGGVSAAPYASANLGDAVGDDPAAVAANRSAAAAELGLPAARVRWMRQVHGGEVAVVEGPADGGAPPEVDGLVAAERGLALAVVTADCVPVLLADPVAGVVGAAHAGRPGLLAGVVPATVEAMRALGARPERLVARTGPAICGRCYEVPAELAERAAELLPASAATTSWGTPAIDIPAGVRRQLADAGVVDIDSAASCTLESADHFSYRRSSTTGRQASYVWVA
ncbi:peptidoglycan editing factor PgeF [Streptomyces sp. DSM 44915]|uniref:Purine nucleoside phosphorylase n=1 Tax=Streptomyces chisholmiae TaxID=3075540 RepID=A0ABU2JJ86_9ACTN|nr:peptidoglycan editing factor PgeF [Streptomyces sp. DSM 44915]MDT0264982.1 peptidoglycan editing factor PgeF [Streptomyces sp. DSM 44915]